MTLLLVAIVATVVFVVASPSRRDALAVSTLELGLGALAVLVLAHRVRLVAAVSAIVREIAEPLFRHATIVGALEVHLGIALWTALRTLVGTVAAVVLAIAEQPLWNTSVVCMTRATLPSGRAIPLTAHVSRFVAIVPAVIVRIAHPQLGNALAVLATELGTRIAGSVV